MDTTKEIEELLELKDEFILSILYRILLCSISLWTTFSAIGISHNLDRKGPVKVSSEFANAVYSQNNKTFSQDIYYLDDIKPGESVDNLNRPHIDLAYNKENLRHIKKLTIDAASMDFNDLLYCPNLTELTITNYTCLDENDKIIINSLPNLRKINFGITFDILKLDNGTDFSWVNDSIQIGFSRSPQIKYDDLEEFYIYKLYDQLSEADKKRISLDFFTQERIEELKNWDSELSHIIESFGFNEETTEEDKIIEIVRYVLDRYEYDPEINEAILQNGTDDLPDEVRIYNTNLLSGAFDKDNQYGICCNYAALTTILGEYSGLNVEYTVGTFKESHAWCTYTDPTGEEFIVDTTFLDGSEKVHYYLDHVNLPAIKYDLIKRILAKEDSYRDTVYVPDTPSDPIRVKSDITYVNEDVGSYNYEIKKKAYFHTQIGLISLLFLEVGVVIDTRHADINYKKSEEKTI